MLFGITNALPSFMDPTNGILSNSIQMQLREIKTHIYGAIINYPKDIYIILESPFAYCSQVRVQYFVTINIKTN